MFINRSKFIYEGTLTVFSSNPVETIPGSTTSADLRLGDTLEFLEDETRTVRRHIKTTPIVNITHQFDFTKNTIIYHIQTVSGSHYVLTIRPSDNDNFDDYPTTKVTRL